MGTPPSARDSATMAIWEDIDSEMHSLSTPYLVIYGGSSFDQTVHTDVHTFNLNTGRWSRLGVTGSEPPDASETIATLWEDKLYVLANGPSTLQCHTLCLRTGAWASAPTKGEPPTKRTGAAHAAVHHVWVYVPAHPLTVRAKVARYPSTVCRFRVRKGGQA